MTSSSSEARISLQPKQKIVLDMILGSDCSWIGFGGAKGGAKSGGMRRILLALMMMFPGIAILLVRRTYDEVYANHVRKMLDEFPWTAEFYHKSDKLFEVPCGDGKTSRLQIGYGENEGDVRRYNGVDDFAVVAIDQAEEFPESDIHLLKSCNRTRIPDFRPKLFMTFNPGGPSHAYLKRIFIEREFQRNEKEDDYAPLVQAYGWDNVEWVRGELGRQGLTATDYYSWDEEKRKEWFLESDYGRDLLGLDPPLPSYYLWGDWNVFAGKYFSRFDRDKHTVDPDEMALKPWYHRWVSIDIGFAHPTAIYWHCFDGKTIWTYREYVASELEADEIGRVIVQESMLGFGPGGLPVMENISEVYLSPDAFARVVSLKTQEQALSAVLRAAGLPAARKADDKPREDGWRLMARSMNDGTWKISRSCERLIKRIPQAQRREDNLEDIKKFDGDDELDSARYGLKSYQRAEKEPLEMRMAAAVNDPDPTMAYQQWIQFQAKERLSGAKVIDLSAYRRGGGRLFGGGPRHA